MGLINHFKDDIEYPNDLDTESFEDLKAFINRSSEELKVVIRDIPNFPKEGIIFKDITPVLTQPQYYRRVIQTLLKQVELHRMQVSTNPGYKTVDAVAGIESRGFIFGMMLAFHLNVPFVLIRKAGKLPFDKKSRPYDLEYGQATIEMHTDSIIPGMKVLIHDDLLATGGTADAAAHLIKEMGGEIAGFNFLIDLTFLKGAEKLLIHSKNITSILQY